MERSDRRQSDVLPSINYVDFERTAREGAQFHQRHSISRASISAASPISPTTKFGPPITGPNYSQASTNGIHTPPDSRRTSNECRQSLPSLQEALFDKPVSFSAPSPMQTPPIGSGSFSAPPPPPPPPPARNNSLPNTMPGSMSRSQAQDGGLMAQTHQSSQSGSHDYQSSSQPSHPSTIPAPPPPPPPPPPSHHQEQSYSRHDSHNHGRPLPPNPYSQTQPPPAIPAMHPPDTSYQPPPPPPPPQPAQHPSVHSPPYQQQMQYPHSSPVSPHYSQQAPPFSNGNGAPPSTPLQYPPYQPSHQSQHPPQHSSAPPPQHQPPFQSQQNSQSGYTYPPTRDTGAGNGYLPEQPGPSPQKGVKRGSGYGSAIERALSLSAIRRDMDFIKEHSARIYHIVAQYQEMISQSGQHPGGIHVSLQEFNEALQRSYRNTEALTNCHQVFSDLSAKEAAAEQSIHNLKMNVGHSSEYGTDDGHSYADDNRSNGSQQPEKKMRRGRAAPPGRCHSCQRAETPEWRRGPDGARTLCNACGLHYAKLTRKLSKNTIGGGSLAARKPPTSPHHS